MVSLPVSDSCLAQHTIWRTDALSYPLPTVKHFEIRSDRDTEWDGMGMCASVKQAFDPGIMEYTAALFRRARIKNFLWIKTRIPQCGNGWPDQNSESGPWTIWIRNINLNGIKGFYFCLSQRRLLLSQPITCKAKRVTKIKKSEWA